MTKCPPGSYNPYPGKGSSSDCLICDAGYYCIEGADSLTGECDPGFYCPAGSHGAQFLPCPAGTYYENSGATNYTDCNTCPEGFYIVN